MKKADLIVQNQKQANEIEELKKRINKVDSLLMRFNHEMQKNIAQLEINVLHARSFLALVMNANDIKEITFTTDELNEIPKNKYVNFIAAMDGDKQIGTRLELKDAEQVQESTNDH